MTQMSIARVHYFDRQFLRTEDFVDEQNYHLAMRRRHNIGHHSWGIVHGLELMLDDDARPAVSEGMAVDGYGRELILPERARLGVAAFDERDTDELDVWLLYDRVASEPTPSGYVSPGQADGAFYRWRELPLLRMDRVVEGGDSRRPQSVAEGELDFDPSRIPADEVRQDWPVFLGRVRRQQSDDGTTYTVDGTGRPLAGLVGGSVVAPGDGRSRMELGGSGSEGPGFAVYVPERDEPALAIDQEGDMQVHGAMRVDGTLEVSSGALELSVISAAEQHRARPWSIYRAQTDASSGHEELRIEMGAGANDVVIGSWSEEAQAFQPCLTVAANGDVTVHGDLEVLGSITEGGQELQVTRRFTEDAEQILLSNFVSGVTASSQLLDGAPRVGSPSGGRPAVTEPAAPDLVAELVRELAEDPSQLLYFARLMRAEGELGRQLRNALEEDDTSPR
ncbi:MAG: hypothetical protein AAF560_18390 [Acidobacteriota bacterium]